MERQDLLKVKEAGRMLGLSERTIWNYIAQKALTLYRGPSGKGPVRLLRSEVENFFRPLARTDKKKVGTTGARR
ncbi:MAG: helix-turn-helix domain-containing protein [Candidatus Riflebacteria bacterium]|nr:helix-turn-helix domain-containing protein [Candidatus Riflebacteria bacterium]